MAQSHLRLEETRPASANAVDKTTKAFLLRLCKGKWREVDQNSIDGILGGRIIAKFYN